MNITQIGDAIQLTIHVGPGNSNMPQLYKLRLTEFTYTPRGKPLCTDVIEPINFFARSDQNAENIALLKIRDWARDNEEPRYRQLERFF